MAVTVRPITGDDLALVGRFLHETLNPRVSAAAWAAAPVVPWPAESPNHGYLLADSDETGQHRVVGAYLAFYSEREIDGRRERFCNLGAWCVAEEYRFHSIKLLRALLRQPNYTFTDLSPSGAVVPLNERLKFEFLDTSLVVMPALPWPSVPGRTRIYTGSDIAQHLTGPTLQIYRDHARAAAAHHVVLVRDGRSCYVVYRRDRRKNLPIFASILYVSDSAMFASVTCVLARHLLLRHGVLAVLAELRITGRRPRPSVALNHRRRKMVKSATLRPEQIDNLYSELVCVAW